jgi:hypothetical protein
MADHQDAVARLDTEDSDEADERRDAQDSVADGHREDTANQGERKDLHLANARSIPLPGMGRRIAS